MCVVVEEVKGGGGGASTRETAKRWSRGRWRWPHKNTVILKVI